MIEETLAVVVQFNNEAITAIQIPNSTDTRGKVQ